ncbi:PEP-CTERM sorting domain-containing protein [Desulfogranum mediterraneum]|uniref:PEP-CTERM sorting domain-containing protein n=1 Tax=Desulfogranum mediterraneum TaxID=160661 RepID=UPI001ABFCEAC|nr:PEP-CTERM sorting domain-containing protein [Desulfogranum mediterraneum]
MFCQTERRWRTSLVALTTLVGVVLSGALVGAVPLPGDLSISGSEISFDTGYFSTAGSATTISASRIYATVGGVDTSTAFDETGLLAPALNPIPGPFTQTGDGLGLEVTASTASSDLPAGFFLGVDLIFDLTNSSATESYEVDIRWTFDNSVDADGVDAYATSEFDLFADGMTEFTDIASDTFFGDEFDGVLTGTFGEVVVDSGSLLFTLTLAPGDMVQVSGEYTLDGEVFLEGTSSAAFSSFVSIDGFTRLGGGGSPVPEPATLLLFGVGLAAVAGRVRRSRNKQA